MTLLLQSLELSKHKELSSYEQLVYTGMFGYDSEYIVLCINLAKNLHISHNKF